MEQNVVHPIDPVYDENASILILGSFPSQKSREQGFFYGHPQNRFWRVLAAVFHSAVPETVVQKRQFLLQHHIALWDVIASCDTAASADSSIRNVTVNDLATILSSAKIKHIYVNGKTAEKFYKKYAQPILGIEARCLPSTSPANAAWSLQRLVDAWSIIAQQ